MSWFSATKMHKKQTRSSHAPCVKDIPEITLMYKDLKKTNSLMIKEKETTIKTNTATINTDSVSECMTNN